MKIKTVIQKPQTNHLVLLIYRNYTSNIPLKYSFIKITILPQK